MICNVLTSKFAISDISCNPWTNDERESPALEIMDITVHKGGLVSYQDPYIAKVKTNEGRSFTSADLSAEALAQVDCVVLTTNHKDFDVAFIQKHTGLIVDLRNMVNEGSDGVYKL